MKKTVAYLLLLSSMALSYGQESKDASATPKRPDLSGTWKLDMSMSDFGQAKSDLPYDELMLIISHRDPEIRITRKMVKKNREFSQELVYHSDGRGETNQLLGSKEKIKSKTRWDGNVLRSRGAARIVIADDVLTCNITDRWEISADGNILTQITSYSLLRSASRPIVVPPANWPDVKRVFKKASSACSSSMRSPPSNNAMRPTGIS